MQIGAKRLYGGALQGGSVAFAPYQVSLFVGNGAKSGVNRGSYPGQPHFMGCRVAIGRIIAPQGRLFAPSCEPIAPRESLNASRRGLGHVGQAGIATLEVDTMSSRLSTTRPGGDSFAGELKQMLDQIIAGTSTWPTYDLF